MTIFVGPNNSGKSRVLEEIARYARTGQRGTSDQILEELHFEAATAKEVDAMIDTVTLDRHHNESVPPNHIVVGKTGARLVVDEKRLRSALMNPDADPAVACNWYLAYNTLSLDGKSRITHVAQQPAGDLQDQAQSSFQTLFRDDVKRAELRRVINEAFGQYLIIDPTNLGKLRLRLSARPPTTPSEERGIDDVATSFHASATLIDQGSDGVKAFTGMMTEIVAGDPQVILIDEPEAFLHPGLATLLGKEVSRASVAANKRLFVSTHSSAFVMGCIQSGAPISIVRLTYRDGVATSRVLESNDILKLMRNPLLRSTGILAGLFYESVVVTESDADRAFYQEVNERLQAEVPSRGIPNCLFLNAQNKQTVPAILRPLRELGIPAAGIVDIDVLKDGGKTWANFADSIFLPDIEQGSISILRAQAKAALEGTGKDMKRDGGIQILSKDDQEAVTSLFTRLAANGLFVVPGGELESWLKHLGGTGKGPPWLIDMFEKMGEDPTSASYLSPGKDDVWAFLELVKGWLVDPGRKGIPA